MMVNSALIGTCHTHWNVEGVVDVMSFTTAPFPVEVAERDPELRAARVNPHQGTLQRRCVFDASGRAGGVARSPLRRRTFQRIMASLSHRTWQDVSASTSVDRVFIVFFLASASHRRDLRFWWRDLRRCQDLEHLLQ